MPYPYKTFREWFADEEKLGNVVKIKTPIKCGDYSNIVDIGHGIPGKMPETEVRALARYLHSLPGKPMAIIENPIDNRPDIPVVINPWPTRERVLRGMGLKDKDEFCNKILNIPTKGIKPVRVSKGEAPCKGVIIPEEKVDLRKDIPRVWVEFNQWLWSGCNGTVIIRDPETGAHSLGKMRAGQYEWKEANPDTPFPEERVKKYMIGTMAKPGPRPSNTMRNYFKYKAQNKPMPAAYVFGVPTDVHELAALKSLDWPESGDEFEILGSWRGEPVELVEAETIPGLMVLAQAEWVIEGEYLLEDEVTPIYGEDQFIGYMVGPAVWPVFRVKCITHKKEPWWTATTFSSSGLHGHDGTHSALATTHMEADALAYLRSSGFKVKDVACLVGPMTTVIQLEVDGADKPYPYYGKKVGMALSTYGSHVAATYIVVVGPDIDPHDPMDVWWALSLLTKPISDSIPIMNTVPGAANMVGFRGGKPAVDMNGEQMIIDATIPVPERCDAWRPRSDPPEWEREAIERMKKKLG